MNLLSGAPFIRIGIYAALVLGLMGFGARLEHNRMQKKLDVEVAAHNQFVGGVEALGREQAKDAANKELWGKLNKEKADAENVRDALVLDAELGRLRRLAAERDSRGGSMSAAPAGSQCPEGQTCFDRAEYQRALGEFDSEARSGAGEGSSVTVDLNTAKRWAQ